VFRTALRQDERVDEHVEVWWSPTRPWASLPLTQAERQRALAHARPDEVASSDVLARRAVGAVLGLDPAEVVVGRRCPRCGSDTHGAPVTAGAHVSITRARGLVAVAVSTVGPVGIDVEQRREHLFAGFDGVALAPQEAPTDVEQRLRIWTRKEALLKACGRGLTVDPRTVVLDGLRIVSAPEQAAGSVLRDVDPPGYLGAVAAPAGAELSLRPTTLGP